VRKRAKMSQRKRIAQPKRKRYWRSTIYNRQISLESIQAASKFLSP
jgi:hypothetical protein